jgi:hypothetical protein
LTEHAVLAVGDDVPAAARPLRIRHDVGIGDRRAVGDLALDQPPCVADLDDAAGAVDLDPDSSSGRRAGLDRNKVRGLLKLRRSPSR